MFRFQDERRIENLALSGVTFPITPTPGYSIQPELLSQPLDRLVEEFLGDGRVVFLLDGLRSMTEIKSRVAAMSGMLLQFTGPSRSKGFECLALRELFREPGDDIPKVQHYVVRLGYSGPTSFKLRPAKR